MNPPNAPTNGAAREVTGRIEEANKQIMDIGQRLSNIEGQWEAKVPHLATKADVERAKIWTLTTIAAAVLSVIAAGATIVIAFMRVWTA